MPVWSASRARRPSFTDAHALNAVCPYFTMFPLDFPLRLLRRFRSTSIVLDPFSGRGTSLYAARCCRARAIGIDCSPVAVAISRAKLANLSVEDVTALAENLLAADAKVELPSGEFWDCA